MSVGEVWIVSEAGARDALKGVLLKCEHLQFYERARPHTVGAIISIPLSIVKLAYFASNLAIDGKD